MTSTEFELVTVGDDVQIKDLSGVIRFVGEIVQKNGIYYGLELSTPKGKNNGTIGNIRYFKCKRNRGLFVRRSAVHSVSPKTSTELYRYRIGMNESIGIKMSDEKDDINVATGTVRYIGTPHKANDELLYYGIEFEHSIGDSDGIYHGIRYFTTVANKQCASFIKATSARIIYPWPRAISSSTESSQSTIDSDYDDETDSSDDNDDRTLRLNEYNEYYAKRLKSINEDMNIAMKITPKYYHPLNDWILNAQNADTFKKRYQCTRSLMEKILKYKANTGDSSQAVQILNIFAEWLEIESHTVLRKHVLQLLIPFANTSYSNPTAVWIHSSIANHIAKSLITKQWTATAAKQGFVSLVTRALIAIYKLQLISLFEWKEWMIAAISSNHQNSQVECCHFLSQIVELSVIRKSFIWIQKDVEILTADAQILSTAKNVLLLHRNTPHIMFPHLCLFVYAVAHLYGSANHQLHEIYQCLCAEDDVSIYFESIRQTPYKNLFGMEPIATNHNSQLVCKKCEKYKIKMQKLSEKLNEVCTERDGLNATIAELQVGACAKVSIATMCNECYNLKADGYSDGADDTWYCVECWNAFNESKVADKYSKLQSEYDALQTQCNEKNSVIEEYEMNKIKQNRSYNIMESKYSSKCVDYDVIESKCVELAAIHEKKYSEMKTKYDHKCKEMEENREQYLRLKDEYNELVAEMDKTKDSCERLRQQLTECQLTQNQQTNDLNKYKEMEIKYKEMEDVKERERQRKQERIQRMTGQLPANKGKGNINQFRDEIKVLKKKNKRRMSQMQDIYEGEYEKLVREYQEYKQRYPPDANDPNHQHEQTQSTTLMID